MASYLARDVCGSGRGVDGSRRRADCTGGSSSKPLGERSVFMLSPAGAVLVVITIGCPLTAIPSIASCYGPWKCQEGSNQMSILDKARDKSGKPWGPRDTQMETATGAANVHMEHPVAELRLRPITREIFGKLAAIDGAPINGFATGSKPCSHHYQSTLNCTLC